MAVSTGQCSVFLPDPFSSFHVLKRGLGNSHYVAPYSLLHVSGHNFFHSLPFHRSVTLEEPLRPRLLRISGSWKRLPAPTLTPAAGLRPTGTPSRHFRSGPPRSPPPKEKCSTFLEATRGGPRGISVRLSQFGSCGCDRRKDDCAL